MIFLNSVDEEKAIGKAEWKAFLQILAPFTPSIAEELWKDAGFSENLHTEGWPVYDSAKTFESEITMPIQINGKLRGTFIVPFDSSDEEVKTSLFKTLEYEKYVGKNEPKKVIIVKNRLVNIVI